MTRYSPLELAEAFIRTGELADALDALNPYLDAHPDDAAALRLRAAVLMRLPGENHARAALTDLDQLPSKTADDLIQQSVIWQMGLGDWQQAVRSAEQAHQLAPHDDRITERLFSLYDQTGDLDKAHALLAALPPTWRWRQLAGDLAHKQRDFAAAIAHYDHALTLLEQKLDTAANPIARSIMGMMTASRAAVRLAAGDFSAAESDYRTAAAVFPKDRSYALLVGVTVALQGKLDEAAGTCRSILRDEPSLAALLLEQAAVYPALTLLVNHLGL